MANKPGDGKTGRGGTGGRKPKSARLKTSRLKTGKPKPGKSTSSKSGSGTSAPRAAKSGARQVDRRKTARVLAKLRLAQEAAGDDAGDAQGASSKLTAWEREFAQSVEAKLEKYGSAFRDASKGNLEEPLSARQAAKLREVVKAAQGKRKPLKRGKAMKRGGGKSKTQWTPRVRRIEDD